MRSVSSRSSLSLLICLAAVSCKRPDPRERRPLHELSPKLEARLEGAAAKAVDVKLAWHPPCRVPAISDTEKKGGSARTSFVVVLAKDGERFALSLEQVRMLMVNGEPADSPAMRDQLEMANALAAAAMPTFLVSASGEYLGVKNLDRTLDALEKTLPDLSGRVLEAMRTPQMRAMIEQKLGDYWKTWAGAWLGLELAPGAHVDQPQEIELPDGGSMKLPSRITHKGTIEGSGGLVLLERVQVLEGPEATRLMVDVVRSMAELAGAGANAPGSEHMQGLRREVTLRAAMDPATSRTHRVRSEMVITMNGTRHVQVQDTAFDWKRAEGCSAPPR